MEEVNATESGGEGTASRGFAAAPRFRSLPRDYAVYLFDRDIISATVYSNSMGAGSRAYIRCCLWQLWLQSAGNLQTLALLFMITHFDIRPIILVFLYNKAPAWMEAFDAARRHAARLWRKGFGYNVSLQRTHDMRMFPTLLCSSPCDSSSVESMT